MQPAPLVVFAYNRPRHLARTLEALAANDLAADSPLILYCDGPKTPDAAESAREVREVAAAARGFASVQVVARERNMGLAASIIDGVTAVVGEYGRVIVVEDDMVTSPFFLRYLNDALEAYADNPRVASIHGWVFPHAVPNPPETFFLRGADCWGWATWKRAWDRFNPDTARLLAELRTRDLEKAFNCDGAYDYTGMLERQLRGTVDSWAVRWHASAFLAGMYTLYPGRTLVHNFGFDGSGTHCKGIDNYVSEMSPGPIPVRLQPLLEDPVMVRARNAFFRPICAPPKRRSFLLAAARAAVPARIRRHLAALVGLSNVSPPPPAPEPRRANTWDGDYPDWASACRDAQGYDNDVIFDKVRDACRQVRDGKAVSERDSVLFDAIEYSWPLLAGILWAAARHGGALRLIDFGGSLGSSYRQNRRFLDGLPEVRWNIVEQPRFVAFGREEFETEQLRFFPDIDSCLRESRADGIVLSAVLSYVEAPYALLEDVCGRGFDFLILDRTQFSPDDRDRITVQHVPEHIYKASYPCRLLSRSRFEAVVCKSFDILEWFVSPIGGPGFDGCIARRKA